MARPRKSTDEVARLEGELGTLRRKLTENENRHAAALERLEEARQARRVVMAKDEATVGAATRKVRELQFEADDLASLADDYRDAIVATEDALKASQDDELRQAAADQLEAIAAKVQEHVPDLIKAIDALHKVRKTMLSSIPAEVGFFRASDRYFDACRPTDRPEGHAKMLSGREMVNAVVAECLYRIDAAMFDPIPGRDAFSGGWAHHIALCKITETAAGDPSYLSSNRRPEPRSPAQAVDALLVAPLRKRAGSILAGDAEPVVERTVVIDPDEPKPHPVIPLCITRPVMFVEPLSDGTHYRQVYTEGARQDVIEPIARLLIMKKAAIDQRSPAGQAWYAEYESRLKAGSVRSEIGPEDYLDLGDPMGCLTPANDDVDEEVARAVG